MPKESSSCEVIRPLTWQYRREEINQAKGMFTKDDRDQSFGLAARADDGTAFGTPLMLTLQTQPRMQYYQ
jgi:hypothetical protein